MSEFLIQRCIEQQEPCVPIHEGESWFSVAFVASVLGYDSPKHFAERLNRMGIPRHPMQNKCIRFSDLSRLEDQNGEK